VYFLYAQRFVPGVRSIKNVLHGTCAYELACNFC